MKKRVFLAGLRAALVVGLMPGAAALAQPDNDNSAQGIAQAVAALGHAICLQIEQDGTAPEGLLVAYGQLLARLPCEVFGRGYSGTIAGSTWRLSPWSPPDATRLDPFGWRLTVPLDPPQPYDPPAPFWSIVSSLDPGQEYGPGDPFAPVSFGIYSGTVPVWGGTIIVPLDPPIPY